MSSGYRDFWKQLDRAASRSKAEYEATENTVNAMKGWHFLGVEGGMIWRASHRHAGRVQGNSSGELLDRVRAADKRLATEKAEQAEAVKRARRGV